MKLKPSDKIKAGSILEYDYTPAPTPTGYSYNFCITADTSTFIFNSHYNGTEELHTVKHFLAIRDYSYTTDIFTE